MDQSAIPVKLLVIAQSARMLAQLAMNAGYRPVAIDCFADEDTRQLAVQTVRVSSLALCDVRPAILAMREKHGLTHLVYGSGFEHHTETLLYLEQDWRILGNSAALFRRVQDKSAFFAQMAILAIQCPETVFSAPTVGGDWLIKPRQGEGGLGISLYDPNGDAIIPGEIYWQRHLNGQAMSVLFLACNGQVRLLGFNRQWTATIDDKHCFVFAGIRNRAELSPAHRQLLSGWLAKLARVYPLKGLGSLDFMLVNDRCYLLEINPRIPASAQLYGASIFSLHVQACLGKLGECASAEPKGYQIVYARKSLRVPDGLYWPEWAVDRPRAGSIIGKGGPICSIIAAGKTAEQVENRLRRRQNFIEKLLNTGL